MLKNIAQPRRIYSRNSTVVQLLRISSVYFFLSNFILSIYLFIFWLCWVFVALRGLSLQLRQAGASLCCIARASHCSGFSCCRAQALSTQASVVAAHGLRNCGSRAQQLWLAGSVVQAQQLWHMVLVALWHVGSSWTRDRTRVPCVGRQILNHCTTW